MLRLPLFLAVFLAWAPAQNLSGRRAPSWCLPDSNHKRYDILDYRGKWLLMDFMRTDCPHCKELSKVLEQAQAKYGAKVQVISVVIAPPDNTQTVARYKEELKMSTPVVFDQGQVAAAYFNATPQRPSFDTPHLFVIDPRGMIVKDWGHNEQTHDIVGGKGLFAELDALMNAPSSRSK
jgi:peroxiredoxin